MNSVMSLIYYSKAVWEKFFLSACKTFIQMYGIVIRVHISECEYERELGMFLTLMMPVKLKLKENKGKQTNHFVHSNSLFT